MSTLSSPAAAPSSTRNQRLTAAISAALRGACPVSVAALQHTTA
ncbi:cobalt transporter, partial [Pseudomonas syringae]